MRILLVGADGQLGRALRAQAGGLSLEAVGRDRLDLRQRDRILPFVRALHPTHIINAAAYTAVDAAESDVDAAYAVNRDGVAALAEAADDVGARLVHFSTDYVFDGRSCRPYRPDDPTAPLNIYGASKLAGEQAVRDVLGDRGLVIRTAWLYSNSGRNFFSTMLRLLAGTAPVEVVADQIGTPTWTDELARVTLLAMHRDLSGCHHWTDAGVASWYDFATAIREEATAAGLLPADAPPVKPIDGSRITRPAARPHYSVLDKSSLCDALDLIPLHWRVSLRRALTR